MTTNAHGVDIAERAMLVSLSISRWKASKKDREITEAVTQQYQAETSYGSFNKRLMPKEALQEVAHAAREARDFHAQETLPWMENGARILPARNFLRYTERMRLLKERFDRRVGDFLAGYPAFREQARLELGGLFNPEDYPDENALRKMFGFEVRNWPIPTGRDFRVSLGEEEAAAIRGQIEAQSRAALLAASRDVWRRAEQAVAKLRDRAKELDQGGKAFRGTVVETVQMAADIMNRLNVMDDPEVEAIRQRIKSEILIHDPETIKTDQTARQNLTRSADDILRRMAGYTGTEAPA